METKEGKQEIYRIAKMRTKKKKDIFHVATVKDKNGKTKIGTASFQSIYSCIKNSTNEDLILLHCNIFFFPKWIE